MIKENTIELNFYNLFHIIKLHWKFIFLPPVILTLAILVFFSTRPVVWEASAEIRVGSVSPAGIGLIDTSALEKIYEAWREGLKKDSHIEGQNIVTKNQDGFLVEAIVIASAEDSAKKAVEQLYLSIQKEQLAQLAISLKDFNMYLGKGEKSLNELRLSIQNNESLLKRYTKRQFEFITLNHLVELQKERESQLSEKILKDKIFIESSIKLKTYFQKSIELKPFTGSSNKNLILVLSLFLSFLTTTTLILSKEFL